MTHDFVVYITHGNNFLKCSYKHTVSLTSKKIIAISNKKEGHNSYLVMTFTVITCNLQLNDNEFLLLKNNKSIKKLICFP